MFFKISVENTIDNVSISFERQEHGPSYLAKCAIIDQYLVGMVTFKLLIWLPYKKWDRFISELYDLELNECDYTLTYEEKDDNIIDVSLKGTLLHRLDKFIKNEDERLIHTSRFEFQFEMQDKTGEGVYHITDIGFEKWTVQMDSLMEKIIRGICKSISETSDIQIDVMNVNITPLQKYPLWKLEMHDNSSIRLYNENYKLSMDIKLCTPLLGLDGLLKKRYLRNDIDIV